MEDSTALPRRRLGRTGLLLSVIGFGGYHLVEASLKDAGYLLNSYLDQGGNYVETAASYGDGASEAKIGLAVAHRRQEYVLASKTTARDGKGCRADLEASLNRLRCDHLDILFMHSVGRLADLAALTATGGALEAAVAARDQGLIRHIGITAHGLPDALIAALRQFDFDVLMTGLNYFDRFNFPAVEDVLLPQALTADTGLLAMKPLADGLLARSAEDAFAYALSLPVASVVTGINTAAQLDLDLHIARTYVPLGPAERDRLFAAAPELGTYICRQCGKCLPCPAGVPIPRVFELEGWYDRQMRDGMIRSAADYGMRERLRFWFHNQEEARAEYGRLGLPARQCTACGECEPRCPYGLGIIRKLDLADYKLSDDRLVF